MESHPPIIIISGAIGSGKGTILHALTKELNLSWVPTHTTRPLRRDDPDLSRRIFETETNFLRHLSRGDFIESVELNSGYRYGLLRYELEKELRENRSAIIEMNVDGGLEVAKQYPNTLLIFLLADAKTRQARIEHRKMDQHESASRLNESAKEEKIARDHYDYLIENVQGHPEIAIDAIKKVIFEHFPSIEN